MLRCRPACLDTGSRRVTEAACLGVCCDSGVRTCKHRVLGSLCTNSCTDNVLTNHIHFHAVDELTSTAIQYCCGAGRLRNYVPGRAACLSRSYCVDSKVYSALNTYSAQSRGDIPGRSCRAPNGSSHAVQRSADRFDFDGLCKPIGQRRRRENKYCHHSKN